MRISALLLAFILTATASASDAALESRLDGTLPGKHDTGHRITLDIDVACDPARTYALWATEAGAESFFAPAAEIGGVGGPYTIIFFPADDPRGLTHGTAGAHVLAGEPGRFFAFEWVVFAGDDRKGSNAPPFAVDKMRRPDPLPTWVEIGISPNASGSHVSFRHFGFLDTPQYRQSQAWFTRAWGGVLTSLQSTCAADPARVRP